MMTTILHCSLTVVLAVCAFLLGAWLAIKPLPPRLSAGSADIHPGVNYSTFADPAGPWRIHVVEIDMHHQELEIESVRALDSFLGREKVSAMAARRSGETRKVLAALNADYFNIATGEVQNNHIAGGTYVKAFTSPGYRAEYVDIPNSQFAIARNRRLMIEQFMFGGNIVWGNGTTSPLAGVNITPRRGGLVVFNSYAPGGYPDGLSLIVARRSGDTLVCVSASPGRNGENIVIAAFRPAELEPVAHYHDTVRVILSMNPNHGQIKELVGGWPRLVRNGTSIFDDPAFPENRDAPMFTRRHPRSGIGFSQDSTTLYFIAVDGRQDGSVGMTLPEFAHLMTSLGVYQGLNLDGGGSTSMIVNGQLVNSPSDPTGERPVGNCVLLVVNTGRLVASFR